MKKFILYSLFLLVGVPVDFSGVWNISDARNMTGNAYKGKVSITPSGDCYRIFWTLENTNPANFSGIGIPDGNSLYVGWGLSNVGGYGVSVYKITPDGILLGEWTDSRSKGMKGEEKATEGKPGQLEGTYQIAGSNPGNQGQYKGELTITKAGEVYNLVWSVAGTSYKGIGIKNGDKLVAGWGFDNKFGLVHYQFSGNAAKGTWAVGGFPKTGTENITR